MTQMSSINLKKYKKYVKTAKKYDEMIKMIDLRHFGRRKRENNKRKMTKRHINNVKVTEKR